MLTLEMRADGYTKRVTVSRTAHGWLMREEWNARPMGEVLFGDRYHALRALDEFTRSGTWPSLGNVAPLSGAGVTS